MLPIYPIYVSNCIYRQLSMDYWGIKNYGEFEEARGWVILNNARAERVHYSESPTRANHS